MNNIHEDSVDFQSNSQEEKQQPSVKSVLSRGSQEEIKFTKGQAGHSDDECSTDLEDDSMFMEQNNSVIVDVFFFYLPVTSSYFHFSFHLQQEIEFVPIRCVSKGLQADRSRSCFLHPPPLG